VAPADGEDAAPEAESGPSASGSTPQADPLVADVAPQEDAAAGRREVSLAAVGRAAVILTGATAGVQVIAIVRELFLAANAGISADLDALLIGLVLPTTISSVLTSGPSTAMVPAYLEARATRGVDTARRLAGTVLLWLGLAGLGLTLLLELIAGPAVAVAGPGLSATGLDHAAGYLRLFAPIALVASLNGTMYAICQAEQRFAAIAVAIVAGAVVALGTMLLFWGSLGLGAFALGNLLGPAVQLAILTAEAVRRSIMPRPHLVSRGLGLGAFARHAAPLTMSSAILQVNAVFDRAVASLIGPGAISALRYGDTLVRVPTGAISPAWGAAIYPALVRSTHESDRSTLASTAERSLRYVLAIFMPLAAITLAVAPIGVAIAYGRGAFTADGLSQTSGVVAGFAPLVVVMMLSQTLTGALNARRRGTDLLMAGTINVVVNCTLDVVFGFPLGVAGVALSSSVTAIVVAAFKARRLARVEPGFPVAALMRRVAAACAATLPGALVVGFFAWSGRYPSGVALQLAVLVVATLGVLLAYVPLAARLGIGEPLAIVAGGRVALARRLRRGRASS
jgi:putative peptidoglycan lipid II flippase